MSKAKKLQGMILTDADRKKNNKANRSKQKINITQWIEEIKGKIEDEGRHSLIYSELLAVMMELAIIKAINKQGDNFDKVVPHPDNFRLKRDDILQSDWNKILSKINRNLTLSAEYYPDNALEGRSYRYPELLDGSLPKYLTLCYGLGLIFLQLLSKRTILPWVLNIQEAGYDWQRILHDLQGKGQISSLNYRIVYACLSPRQRENWRLDKLLNDKYVEESFMDNPRIQTIKDLEKELRESLKSLKENLISVANEEHRQLIIIDLL